MTNDVNLDPSSELDTATGDGTSPVGVAGPAADGAGTGAEDRAGDGEESTEAVEKPAKVMRIGSMIKQLLEEVRHAPLDEASRDRLKDIYETSVKELASGLSGDLREELERLTLPLAESTPSDAELRIAQAQLVGWLEGLFHGIQATLFAQQVAARAQLEEMMQQRGLPAASGPSQEPGGPGGAYL